MTIHSTRGRGWAYTGAILGGLVSIAANVAHSFIPPTTSTAGWSPEPGAVVGAIVWPVFLFVAVEILARTTWPQGSGWQLLRWAGLLPVAAVAAFVSYRHLSGLLTHYGEEPIVAVLGPLAVDGLMIMATGALIATGRHHTTVPANQPFAVVATPAPAVPATPSVPVPATVAVPAAPTSPAPVPVEPDPVPSPAAVAARITPRPTTSTPAAQPSPAGEPAARPVRARPRPTRTTAARLAPSTIDNPVTASDAAQPPLPLVTVDLVRRARTLIEQHHASTGDTLTAGQLAARLRVSTEVATRVLHTINTDTRTVTTAVRTVNGATVKAAR